MELHFDDLKKLVISNSECNCPISTRVFQQTAGLTFTCLQTEVIDHTNLGVTCCQNFDFPNRCWIFRPELPLKSVATQIPHVMLAPNPRTG